MKNHWKQGLLAACLGMMVLGGCAVERVGVAVQPRRPVYVRPAAPYPDYVWIDGNWVWSNRHYVWREGYWAPPRRGRAYVPGRWMQTPRGYRWRKGHW
jgi:hypothetical protein